MTVAALYIDPRGPYPALGVDCWDAARDARLYEGPGPVVAHPPCGPWGRLRHLSRHDDPALAVRAVEQVRLWGGVLEHPAGSLLWEHCRLPLPGWFPDEHGGRTIEVCQVEWGHVLRKRSWLYLVGVGRVPAPPFPGRAPTHWASGGRTKSSRTGSPVPHGIKVASAQQRRRTPIEFARFLISLAATAHPHELGCARSG